MARAPLIEVFHSIQGEGRFVGAPMTFLRVATCPLRCRYCDTPHSYEAAATFPVVGAAATAHERNPVEAARAAELVPGLWPAGVPRPCLSVTGGEPLVFPQFVHELGDVLRARGHRVHLETAAIDGDALQWCIDSIDHLSADYKLPETLADGRDHGEQHVRCVELGAAAGITVDVKIVLTAGCTDASLQLALRRLQPLRGHLLLILQPVTPFGAERQPLPPARLQEALAMAHGMGFEVRVLPQVHKILALP